MKRAIAVFNTSILIIASLQGQGFELSGNSIYADIKAHNIGDVVMVLIAETANASQESKVKSSAQSNVSANGSVSGNLTDFLPLFGASSSLSNSHDGTEGTQQKEKLTGKLSATIIEKTEGGMLKLKGERTVEVNGEKNIMRLEGLVRPRDIRSDNTVYSYNIADAKIVYKKNTLARKFTKSGTVQKWTTRLLGLALVFVAYTGLSSK